MLNPCTKFEKPFVVEPQVVTFLNYEKDRVYIKEVLVKNNGSLCDTIHVNFKEEVSDEISLNIKGCQRLVPGLDLVLEVTFKPNRRYKCQKKDRVFEVELLVEIKGKQSYKFLLPVILLSPNPSFVFPKEVFLPTVCSGILSSSTIFFCNNSPSIQRFSLWVSKDINLKPYRKIYSIPSGKHEILTIQAKPGEIGEHKTLIQYIQCDCEKQDSISILLCCVECLPVYVRNTDINFPDTYLGLKNEEQIEIVNDGDQKVKFKFIDEASKFFETDPFKGEVDPNSSVRVKCTFHPPCDFESTNGSCSFIHEVVKFRYGSGSNQKITEVHLNGIALAPKIVILQNEIELGLIHCGEVIEFNLECRNEGLIDGQIAVQDIESRFGAEITIDPQILLLKPNDQGTFHVKYINCHIGRFLENIALKVKFGDLLNVQINGKVEKLTVQISPEVLDFGEVSICCRQYQCMRVKNILNHPIKVDFEFDGQECRSAETLLSFDEFEATKPSQMVEIHKNSSSVSFASYVSTASQIEFSSLLEKLLVESEDEISNDQIENSLFSSVEAVNSVLGQILCQIDDYLDVDDFRQNLQRNVHQMIDDWIESKQLVDLLVDDVLEDLLKDYEMNQNCIPLIPFFEKKWILNANSQEYSLGVSTSILLKPLEMQIFRLNLVPNWPGIFRSRLKVFVSWNDDRPCSSSFSIPIFHNCIIPDLVLCHTDIISLDLFVGQTSCNIIRIRNLNDNIDGFIRASMFENDEIQIKCMPEKEIVPRDTEVNFKITVTPLVTGNFQYKYELYILGSDQPLKLTFKVNSRPVRIKVDPKEIITENMLPGKVESTKFIMMNLTPVQLKYQLRLAPNRYGTEAFQIEPYEPCLLPYDIVEVGIRQFFDTPGYYETCCFIDVQEDYGKSQEIKIQTHVMGIPLKIFPAINDNLLDLGMIIYNKKPYPQLEFSVENTGQVKYFVILKLMYDEDFKIDENRVEIQPRECKTFTIQICPKVPKNINNALFFNASQTGKNKDFETFKMINLKGKFIKQKVSFSKSEVSMEIRYDDDFTEKGHATIQLMNDSLIFLLIHCTINGDYELIDAENCQIGNFLDIELASKERRELIIQFNTKLLQNHENQSKTFPAKLKAYVDGKVQAVANVSTTLKYPTIEIPETCFQIFQSQLEVFTTFEIRNAENIDAEYFWELVEESLVFEGLEKKAKSEVKSVIDKIFEHERDFNVMENVFNEQKLEENDEEIIQELFSEEEDEISEVTSIESQKKSKKKSKRVSIGSNISEKLTKENKLKKKKKEIEPKNASLENISTKIKKKRKSKGSINSEKSIKSIYIAPETIKIEEISKPIIEITAKELEKGIFETLNDLQPSFNASPSKIKPKICDKNSILGNLLTISPSTGLLQAGKSQSVSLFFKTNPFPCKYSFNLKLKINHGCSKLVKIFVINDEIHLELNKTEIDFGSQPWYSILRDSFTISTTSSIPLNVKFLKNPKFINFDMIKGQILPKNEDGIKLNSKFKKQKVKFLTFLGIIPDFETILGMEVNNRAPILIKICGKSQIPNVTFLNCHLTMSQIDQKRLESDYFALKIFFNKRNNEKSPIKVKKIVKNEHETLVAPANSRVSIAANDFSDAICEKLDLERIFFEEIGDLITLTSDMKVIRHLKSQEIIFDPYFDQAELDELGFEVLTSYPSNNLPSFWEIKNYLEQSQLIRNYNNSSEVKSKIDHLAGSYVLQKFNSAHMNATPRYIYSGRPTNFVIEPIPENCLNVQCYSLDMGDLKIGENHQFLFEFMFHGPGIFNAAIRSEREIPGLSVKVRIFQKKKKFYPKKYYPEAFKSKARYHPCQELSHAHSHDFTQSLVHVRKPLNFDEKYEIKQFYNQLSVKNVKIKVRHPNTLAEIFQETSRDASGQIFRISIDFLPSTNIYGKKFLEFHEILHLDVHLGVSVALHLKAKMFPKHPETSCECIKPDECLKNN